MNDRSMLPQHRAPLSWSFMATRNAVLVTTALMTALCSQGESQLIWNFLHQEIQASRNEEVLSLLFVCRNRGAESIEIDNVYVDCGCISAEVIPTRIVPGGTATLTASIETTRFAGARSFEFTVRTKDAKHYPLTAQVIVPGLGYFSPTKLGWSLNEDPAPKSICFRSLIGPSLLIEKVDYDADKIQLISSTQHDDIGQQIVVKPLRTDAPFMARVFVYAKSAEDGIARIHTAYLAGEQNGDAELFSTPPSIESQDAGLPGSDSTISIPSPDRTKINRAFPFAFVLLLLGSVVVIAYIRHRRTFGKTAFLSICLMACLMVASFFPAMNGGALDNEQFDNLKEKKHGLALLQETPPKRPGPRISAENGWAHEISEIPELRAANHRFLIRNQGDEDLILKKGRRSSGQISFQISSRIPPRKIGYVDVEYTGSVNQPAQNLFVEIETNDPELPKVTFRIHGYVHKTSSESKPPVFLKIGES